MPVGLRGAAKLPICSPAPILWGPAGARQDGPEPLGLKAILPWSRPVGRPGRFPSWCSQLNQGMNKTEEQ